MTKNKIILADDHQFLMEGITIVLKEIPDIEVVETAQNGFELMDAVAKQKPQLVILDLNMPGYDGIQCLKKIKANWKQVKVLVLTNYNQPKLVEQVKALHAEGFLVKNSSAQELKGAIRQILSGQLYFPSTDELKSVPDGSYFSDEFSKKYQLTKREIEIIQLICREKSSKQIASELFLSDLTVKTHRRNILKKLELKNVAGLFNFAKEHLLL